MKPLTVIGLDGESWSEIERYRRLDLAACMHFSLKLRKLKAKLTQPRFSIFERLKKDYACEVLLCDTEIVHTVPSWTLAFSGIRLNRHKMACYFKPNHELWKSNDFQHPFLWDLLEKQGYHCKGLTLKIFGLNFHLKEEVNVGKDILIPTTYSESIRSIRWAKDKLLMELDDEYNLFVYTSPFPDHALHLLHDYKITSRQYVNIRIELDNLLKAIMPFMLEHDFIIMSDHGHPFVVPQRWEWNGQQGTNHHREGIIVTNLKNPPTKLSNVFPYLLRHFKIEAT